MAARLAPDRPLNTDNRSPLPQAAR